MQNLFRVTIMNVYHGTNIKFDMPKILKPNRALDFGAGFYTTTDEEQAISWAKEVVKRSNKGVPLLNVYELDENFLTDLTVKRFDSATKEWLDFVCEHRLNIDLKDDCDLIIGPVANDTTMPAIQLYINAIERNPSEKDFFAEFAIRQLRVDRLKDQVVFKTAKSLQHLKLKEIIPL
jgi:hypothetical protein